MGSLPRLAEQYTLTHQEMRRLGKTKRRTASRHAPHQPRYVTDSEPVGDGDQASAGYRTGPNAWSNSHGGGAPGGWIGTLAPYRQRGAANPAPLSGIYPALSTSNFGIRYQK